MTACISEPISWLRLEQYVLAATVAADAAAIDAHVAQCAACRVALETVQADAIVLPALPTQQRTGEVIALASARSKPTTAKRWLTPLLLAPVLAAAAAGVLWLRTGPFNDEATLPTTKTSPHATTSIKGVGQLALQLARDRRGQVQTNVTTFRTGDRWKALLTCAPLAANSGTTNQLWADVAVLEIVDGIPVADFPQPPTQLRCGNAVAIPGAFAITGMRPNLICVTLGVGAPIDREAIAAQGWQGASIVCSEVVPE